MPLMILSRRRKRFALRLVTILLLFGIIAEYKCTPVDNNVTFNALEINNDIRRRTGTIEFWPTTSKNDQQSSSTSSATTTSNITVNVVAGNQQRKDCTVVVSDRIKGFLNWSQVLRIIACFITICIHCAVKYLKRCMYAPVIVKH